MGIAAYRRRNNESCFERLGVDGSDTEQYQVSAYHSSLDGWSEALKPGESLDDLNYLAALLTQRSDEERDKFAAAAQYGDHAASAADLINLTHNLDCYWLYPTVHNSDVTDITSLTIWTSWNCRTLPRGSLITRAMGAKRSKRIAAFHRLWLCL